LRTQETKSLLPRVARLGSMRQWQWLGLAAAMIRRFGVGGAAESLCRQPSCFLEEAKAIICASINTLAAHGNVLELLSFPYLCQFF